MVNWLGVWVDWWCIVSRHNYEIKSKKKFPKITNYEIKSKNKGFPRSPTMKSSPKIKVSQDHQLWNQVQKKMFPKITNIDSQNMLRRVWPTLHFQGFDDYVHDRSTVSLTNLRNIHIKACLWFSCLAEVPSIPPCLYARAKAQYNVSTQVAVTLCLVRGAKEPAQQRKIWSQKWLQFWLHFFGSL